MLSINDLTHLNRERTMSFEQAADLAYMMASRWGGRYFVCSESEQNNYWMSSSRIERETAYIVAAAESFELGKVSWQWMDGRDHSSPAPANPLDRLPQPKPPQLVEHLEERTRVLMETSMQVLAIQRAYSTQDFSRFEQVLFNPAQRISADKPVSFMPYLERVEAAGRVEEEIERLENGIELARTAYHDNMALPALARRERAYRVLTEGKVAQTAQPEPPVLKSI